MNLAAIANENINANAKRDRGINVDLIKENLSTHMHTRFIGRHVAAFDPQLKGKRIQQTSSF
jgi:hypothetical protein